MLCPPRWACLRSCLPSGLGCCVRLAGLVFLLSAVLSPVLSAILAGMPCPPRWAVSQLVSHLVWDALSASLVLSFSCLWSCLPAFVFVLSRSLSFIWDAVSAHPGLVPQTVYCWGSQCCLQCVRLGWGAVSASLGLSPNLSPIWLCLSPWLGCCVRLAGLVSQFVSHLALSFTLAGVLCPPRWACLPICLPPGFVFHLGWGAVSASLGLSPNLSPIWLCLSAWLGCCVCLAGLVSGLVSQFVSHLALSFTLAGCCVRLAGLVSQFVSPSGACLRSCLPPGFVFYVGWGVVSASLGWSPNLSPNLYPTWLCLSPWLGCCVRLAGLVS